MVCFKMAHPVPLVGNGSTHFGTGWPVSKRMAYFKMGQFVNWAYLSICTGYCMAGIIVGQNFSSFFYGFSSSTKKLNHENLAAANIHTWCYWHPCKFFSAKIQFYWTCKNFVPRKSLVIQYLVAEVQHTPVHIKQSTYSKKANHISTSVIVGIVFQILFW